MQMNRYPFSVKEWLLFSHTERISIMKTSMKKKAIGTCAAALCAVSAMSATMIPASAATKTNSHYYYCLAHRNKGTDMYIQLAASYSGKKVSSVWWNSSYAHWAECIYLRLHPKLHQLCTRNLHSLFQPGHTVGIAVLRIQNGHDLYLRLILESYQNKRKNTIVQRTAAILFI